MPIRAIIVDFYDVLYIEQDPLPLRAYEKSRGLPEGGVREVVSRSSYFSDARLGRVSAETLWRDVACSIGASPEEWQTIVSLQDSIFGLNEDLVAVLQKLHPRYKIALLTNATPHVRQIVTRRFHLSHLFDTMVISAEVGVKKPEPESFEYTLQRLQIPAHETVFVDDIPKYVAAAQASGMSGIVFHTTQQVITDLYRLLEANEGKRFFSVLRSQTGKKEA